MAKEKKSVCYHETFISLTYVAPVWLSIAAVGNLLNYADRLLISKFFKGPPHYKARHRELGGIRVLQTIYDSSS